MANPDPLSEDEVQTMLRDLAGEADPGLLALADQYRQAAVELAFELLAATIRGELQAELGNEAAGDRCTVALVEKLARAERLEVEGVAIALLDILTKTMYHQWGGSWGEVARAMLDPTKPLLPGLPMPEPMPGLERP